MRTAEAHLEEVGVFRGLAGGQLERIASCAVDRAFEAGEYLLREGDPATTCFAVRHGTVALETFVPHRGAVMIETMHPGDVVGWSWLFPPQRTGFDARALGVVRTIAFDAECLRARCEEDSSLGYELMKRFGEVIVERLQSTRLRLLDVHGQPRS